MPSERALQILAAAEALASLPEPSDHVDVKKMQGDSAGAWRLRVGECRLVFKLYPQTEDSSLYAIVVTHIGIRGDVY